MRTDSSDQEPGGDFRPSRFMRERRPHLYSDSKKKTQYSIAREVLSHHLETLTNEKDEATFETFAHRLAEKFIAPNLRPQTGPTGGGDGKTDAETYPVAKSIALRWYVPEALPAHERWAFAFSTKKKWRDKVKSDVGEIVATGRGYPTIYFITSQYVPAKDSAAVQDALKDEHGVSVVILDRKWVLDCVFDHDSLDIAVDVLGVGAGTAREVEMPGPEDTRRLSRLAELEKAIGDGSRYGGTPHALIEDCIEVALLARGLEKPREDIEGRFLRAVRIARENRLPKLELAAVYNWAWTSFFWFDDPATLNERYDDVEKLALSSDAAEDLERLSNLISLLRNSVAAGALADDEARLEARSSALTAALSKVHADTSRPNNSLHAHALLLLGRLAAGAHERATEDDFSALWDEFRQVIEQSDGLGTFPFESIADTLTQVGEFIPETPSFDRLYEVLTDKLAARRSEGEAAAHNSTRGFQKLAKNLPYEAIRWFGRSVSLLVKAEYEDELLRALVGSSIAYQEAGLPWAARNYALAAVSQEFSAFARTGSVTELNPASLSRLFSAELELGRVPYILSWFHLWATVSHARATTPKQQDYVSERRFQHSGQLAALLLKTPHAQLLDVARLPDALDRLGLHEARLALLFLMGREDVLRAEGSVPPQETPEGYLKFFDHMVDFGRRNISADKPDYLQGERAELASRVLGVEVRVSCANNITSISVGEAILGTLEALLATSLGFRILPHFDCLSLRVDAAAGADLRPTLEFIEEGGTTVGVVTHARKVEYRTREDALSFPNWLHEAAIHIFARLGSPESFEDWSATVLEGENAFSRALLFSNVPGFMSVVHGDATERLLIDDWYEDGDVAYEVTRNTPWRPQADDNPTKPFSTLKPGEGEPPAELYDTENLKHSNVRFVSPIDVPKWDEAKWRAAFFMTMPDAEDVPPVFCLGFLNVAPAAAIFHGLSARFGQVDEGNALRVAIIRGVWSSRPYAYAVALGPNFDAIPVDGVTRFGFGSRIQIMTPASRENLDRFLAEYRRHGRYILAPAHLPSLNSMPTPMMDVVLGKYDLAVREAWEIGPNDPDAIVLDPDDPPIIPPGQTDAPALKAIKRLRALERTVSDPPGQTPRSRRAPQN